MSNTTSLIYHIDSNLKKDAEAIIYKLGITPSIAIQMFYEQIIIHNGLPFDVKLQSYQKPIELSSLSKEELNAELMKGYESIKNEKTYTPGQLPTVQGPVGL